MGLIRLDDPPEAEAKVLLVQYSKEPEQEFGPDAGHHDRFRTCGQRRLVSSSGK